MTAIVNTEQARAWNDYEGRHWADNADRYDAVNSGFNDLVLAAAGIGERDRVLDVGCGNGQLTRLAAARARLGRATGVDLSQPMLTVARVRAAAEGVGNVGFVRGDAQVHPFADGEFDVALSRFGVMFFADPVAAFGNVRRALRPRGRLAFLAMTDAAGTDLGAVFGAIAGHVGGPSANHGPLSLSDPDRTRSVLAAAGFADISCTHVEAEQVWGRDAEDAAAFLAGWGPVRHHVAQAGPEVADQVRAALTAALRPFTRAGAVRLRGTAWLVTAVADHPGAAA